MFDYFDEMAEELYMRGFNVYEESPRSMWYKYMQNRDHELSLPHEISPKVRGFKDRAQTSLFLSLIHI